MNYLFPHAWRALLDLLRAANFRLLFLGIGSAGMYLSICQSRGSGVALYLCIDVFG
jgi:hypothetical protein